MRTIYRLLDPRERSLLVALLLSVVPLMLGPFPSTINSALGAIVGVLAGFLISRYYSRKASAEMQESSSKVLAEVQESESKLRMMLNAMEEAGFAKWGRDEEGNIVSRIVEAAASSSGSSDLKAAAKVVRRKDTPPREEDQR